MHGFYGLVRLRVSLLTCFVLQVALVTCSCIVTQWDRIQKVGPICLVTQADWQSIVGCGLGVFSGIVEGLYDRVSEFIFRMVSHSGDAAVRSWRNWVLENPLVHA